MKLVDAYLRQLLKTGLYGDTVPAVKHRLICEGIERALVAGSISRPIATAGAIRAAFAHVRTKPRDRK